MNVETKARELLSLAEIEVNGPNPWDIQVHNPDLYSRVFAHGSLGFGEAYIDGWWSCEQLDECITRILQVDLESHIAPSPDLIWLWLKSVLINRQNRRGAREPAKIHYDLPTELIKITYCDKRTTGSCGYWKEGVTNIDQAQNAKLDLVCKKLNLKPGEIVLDIGCGWGAFMGFAAQYYGVECFGITISPEQANYANLQYRNLPVDAVVQDYRDFTGKVEKIASMGMFEHVGPKNYRAYFEMAHRSLMGDDPRFVLHTIWGKTPDVKTEPFIDKYVFPNGVLPTVGQIGKAVEGLFNIEDVENFGVHYDKTLMAWNAGFQQGWPCISGTMALPAFAHGDPNRFKRMWEFYLLSCAAAFRCRAISVGQFVLSPKGIRGGYVRPRP
jgi:cyclopropane-fatty-acyl-phospholipid synthase